MRKTSFCYGNVATGQQQFDRRLRCCSCRPFFVMCPNASLHPCMHAHFGRGASSCVRGARVQRTTTTTSTRECAHPNDDRPAPPNHQYHSNAHVQCTFMCAYTSACILCIRVCVFRSSNTNKMTATCSTLRSSRVPECHCSG